MIGEYKGREMAVPYLTNHHIMVTIWTILYSGCVSATYYTHKLYNNIPFFSRSIFTIIYVSQYRTKKKIVKNVHRQHIYLFVPS